MNLTVLDSLNELTGKRIKYIHEEEYGPYVFLTDDNCILIFETQDDEMLFIDECHLGRFFSTHQNILKDMLNKKVLKEEQISKQIEEWEAYQERVKKLHEIQERKEYERLKAKFEK